MLLNTDNINYMYMSVRKYAVLCCRDNHNDTASLTDIKTVADKDNGQQVEREAKNGDAEEKRDR